MKLTIKRMESEHLPLVDAFSCVETDEMLSHYNSKQRRRIYRHSKEMEDFIKNEAWLEQTKGLNTTYLLINTNENDIAGYVSLCNDSIRLDLEERDELNLTYTTIPAMKIARLAVSNKYQRLGIGKSLITFSVGIGQKIRNYSGLAFLTLDYYEHRVSFYESVGFIKNIIQPIQLPYDSPISMRLVLDDYLKKLADEN